MKSLRIVFISLFVLLTAASNAQVFVGGNFGVNTAGGTNADGTKRPSELNFNVSPKIGKFISDKVALGIALNVTLSSNKTNATIQTINTSSTLGITPFMRYYAIKADKFSIFGQGNLGFSASSSNSKVDGTTNKGPKTNSLSLNFVPGIAYDLNEKISLETSLNIFNVGYNQTVISNGANKTTTSGFGVGAGLNNLMTVGNITIGAIYKF